MNIKANNPKLNSWISVDNKSDFPIQNLPFGIISNGKIRARAASRIGDFAIDLLALYELGYLDNLNFKKEDFDSKYLNQLIKRGKTPIRNLRNQLSDLLSEENDTLQNNSEHQKKILIPISEIKNELPISVGDYTDFYSSIEHATNVGCLFRDPKNALMPNWKYIPVGYHGRSSSIILSGKEIFRPKGQQKPKADETPVFGASKKLDFELEMAFITFDGKPLGESISPEEADDYIFGMVLFNDWSARDIQAWEYVPLGPFLGKNFASTMSAWIVTLDALEPFRVKGPEQDPKVFPYLEFEGNKNIDINLEVLIQAEGHKSASSICNSNFKYMYWNQEQQLAHHTINGCNIKAGDLYGSGTISGPTKDSYGSMLELSWNGSKSIKLKNGEERTFIQDNDTVIMRGHCEKDGVHLGFGEAIGKILPAK